MATQPAVPREVQIGRRRLEGLLRLPPAATGLVVFAHGSGSSRFSRRNTFVAGELGRQGLGTLLFDLLTERESEDRRNVFDIALLGERVLEAIDWAAEATAVAALPLGLFGASTGAAAALVAAASRPAAVAAVVSRGGRPDLAGEALPLVRAPTLLIVGGADYGVIELNEEAATKLACERSVAIVPGATHLFEEAGALEAVVELASDWFLRHLAPSPAARR
jgi:putative phosphoribosyl transferase